MIRSVSLSVASWGFRGAECRGTWQGCRVQGYRAGHGRAGVQEEVSACDKD